ncbi:MAG: hypothetical protein KJO82_15040 [Gammaproteobacteria bacterium]|nr:hypothetical protein [Gammaproteobacteria bacterium]
MRNLLLLLLLANILYLLWGSFTTERPEPGVVVVEESELGPPLAIAANRDVGGAASVGAALGSGEPSALAGAIGRSCVTIGPFTAGHDAESARSRYAGEGMRTSLRSTKGEIFIGHWVQIRNVPDRITANKMLDKLNAGGLADAYLVPNDDGSVNISLGLFGDLERAERVELQAESLNLPADVAPRMREDTVFYVDVGLPPGRGAGAIIETYGEERVLLRDAATCPQAN